MVSLVSVILAFCSLFPFVINLNAINKDVMEAYSGRFNIIFNELRLSLDGNRTEIFCLFFLLAICYFWVLKTERIQKRKEYVILAVFFSLVLVFGESYQRTASWSLVLGGTAAQSIKAFLCVLGYAVLLYFGLILLNYYTTEEKKKVCLKIKICSCSKRGILMTSGILLLCWLPYLIVKYPGILAWDTGTALKLYFDGGKLNNGVPLLQVLIFTRFVKLGMILGNANLGVALFSYMQSLIFAGIIGYFICFLEKLRVQLQYRIFLLALFSFLPIIPYSAMQMGSDVSYAITIMVYCILLLDFCRDRETPVSRKKVWIGIAVLSLTALFRHTGIYVVALSLFMGIWGIGRRNRKSFVIMHLIPIAVYWLWSSFAVPMIADTNASSSSVILGITRQQIANYVVSYGDDLSEEEKANINAMIDIERVEECYNPELTDGIWSITNRGITSEQTSRYLVTWFKLFFRHPDAYLQAANNMWYGYYYPNYISKTKYYMFYELTNISDAQNISIEYRNTWGYERELVDSWWKMLYKFPIAGTFFGIGIYTWMLLFALYSMLLQRNRKYFPAFAPVIITLLICMASPVCGYTRYAFPIMFNMPFLFGIWFQYSDTQIGIEQTKAIDDDKKKISTTERPPILDKVKRYVKRFWADLKKYIPYAVRAAKSDLRSEVANSYLDWLWWLIEPFCMMLIYTVIFGVVFNASERYFPIFIFTGITMWGFFSRSISGSIDIVRKNRAVITKIYMPKYILLFTKLLVNAFKMLVSFGVIVLMMLFFRVRLTIYVLFAVPILLVLFLFTFGLGSILMHYGVYVNDLGYITGIVLSMLMYLTGVFYSVSKRIPAPFGEILEKFNPVAFLLSSMRGAVLYGQAPDVRMLLVWGGIALVMIALGVFTIYSNENAYVKVI